MMLELAETHLREGRFDAAEQAARELLACNPEHQAAAWHFLGLVRWRRGDALGAIAHIERAIALPNVNATWHVNLAEMYRTQGRLDEALNHGKRGVSLGPDNAAAWYNLGIIHYDRGEIAEAIACERRAIELEPNHPGAHFELAEALLLDGNFRAGWDEYEWRFKMASTPPLMPAEMTATGRAWNGESLKDKTLLLIADQGFGDTIQFMRYIPDVARKCRKLVVACGYEMKPLMAQITAKLLKPVQIFQIWSEAPAFDFYMALSSLPRFFGTELDTIPGKTPYLHADLDRLDHWHRRLQALTSAGHRRIGLVWAGRPEHGNDRNRSIPLDGLASLATLNDVTLVSLQKGEAAAQVGSYYGAAPFINLGPEIKDFMDTAAIIENLDLVVTVDTSTAHLAGALNRPAAILLPFAPDWRWLRNRTDSPWYPSLRLYRQTKPGDWRGVIERLMQDLRKHPAILQKGFAAA